VEEVDLQALQTGFRPQCLPTLCLKTYPNFVFSSTRDYFSFVLTQPEDSEEESSVASIVCRMSLHHREDTITEEDSFALAYEQSHSASSSRKQSAASLTEDSITNYEFLKSNRSSFNRNDLRKEDSSTLL
jgi:hypothetical protein